MIMKKLTALIAMIMVVGVVGLSQAFACMPPSNSLPARARTSVAEETPKLESSQAAYEPAFKSFDRRDLAGRYASTATATFFDPTANRTQYATCIGIVTFDGRGHFIDREVHSYDGVIVRDEFIGTYTLSSEGHGRMHFVGENETYDYEFVVSNDLKEITYLVMLEVPGLVSNGTLKKQ